MQAEIRSWSSVSIIRAPSNAESITTAPPPRSATSAWLWHPVTWNSGTTTSVRRSAPDTGGIPHTRNAVSTLASTFSCVCMAPLGNPVVPLV